MNDIHAELEDHVEKNVKQVVEKGFEQAKDIVDGLFNRIRSILPEGGLKGDER
jgi:polyhydroxyalkanoate synthesis regulator phasin